MTLKQAIAAAQKDIQSNVEQVVSVNATDSWSPARSYPSTSASDFMPALHGDPSPFHHSQVSFRPGWKVQEAAQTQSKVLTSALLKAVQVSGIAVSPTSTNANLVAVPDMVLAVTVPNSQVQISWNISASESLVANQASFALFRDGRQIGVTQWGNSPSNNAIFSVSQTMIDSPSPGLHSYALYWATSAGTITANGKQRNLAALILKPQ